MKFSLALKNKNKAVEYRYLGPPGTSKLVQDTGGCRGIASIFQTGRVGGGGGSECVTPRVLTRLFCRHLRCVLLKVTFLRMSSERGGRDMSTKKLHR